MVGVPKFSSTTSQGARRRRFLPLMVGALGFSDIASQGARRRCFLVLMVGAPGSPSAPVRGPVVDAF
jgi:hypothetical protein